MDKSERNADAASIFLNDVKHDDYDKTVDLILGIHQISMDLITFLYPEIADTDAFGMPGYTVQPAVTQQPVVEVFTECLRIPDGHPARVTWSVKPLQATARI